MSNYKYRCPTTYGYKKIKLSNKEHNKYFGKKKWHEKYEYYMKDNHIKSLAFINVRGILISVLLSPINALALCICYHSWNGFKTIWNELTDMFNQKERGMFYERKYYLKK